MTSSIVVTQPPVTDRHCLLFIWLYWLPGMTASGGHCWWWRYWPTALVYYCVGIDDKHLVGAVVGERCYLIIVDRTSWWWQWYCVAWVTLRLFDGVGGDWTPFASNCPDTFVGRHGIPIIVILILTQMFPILTITWLTQFGMYSLIIVVNWLGLLGDLCGDLDLYGWAASTPAHLLLLLLFQPYYGSITICYYPSVETW